jgi:hypothetical protein
MPQHKGTEPWTDMWIMQVRVQLAQTSNLFLSCRYFASEAGYLTYKDWLKAQPLKAPYIYLVSDYGKQKWFNDKLWINFQLNDLVINGNFQPNFSP